MNLITHSQRRMARETAQLVITDLRRQLILTNAVHGVIGGLPACKAALHIEIAIASLEQVVSDLADSAATPAPTTPAEAIA